MELRRRRRDAADAERLADAAECCDHGHRAGQHRRHACRVVPDRLPRQLLALDGPWFPVPAAHDAGVELHEGMGIGVLHDLNLPTVIVHRADLDGQLFAELPAERVSDTFPRLHLAAWKLPRACVRLSFGAGVQQKPAIWPEQDANGHRDSGVGLKLHDADKAEIAGPSPESNPSKEEKRGRSRSPLEMKILVRAATALGRSARKQRNRFGTEITHCPVLPGSRWERQGFPWLLWKWCR